MNGKFDMPRPGREDDNSHPPIHPTQAFSPRNKIGPEQERLYELIARHFLACCSRDARGMQSRVDVAIGREKFFSTGSWWKQEPGKLERGPNRCCSQV